VERDFNVHPSKAKGKTSREVAEMLRRSLDMGGMEGEEDHTLPERPREDPISPARDPKVPSSGTTKVQGMASTIGTTVIAALRGLEALISGLLGDLWKALGGPMVPANEPAPEHYVRNEPALVTVHGGEAPAPAKETKPGDAWVPPEPRRR
jgi:hypothetical protein